VPASPSDRIQTLDLIRGVAVLGILAVNITSFAAAPSANYSPDLPRPGSTADHWAFPVMLVLFEGKMRALFSILFGASLLLFVDRADAAGRDGERLQLHRLGWLAGLGLLHYLLLWRGDILFLYAVVGLAAFGLRRAPPLALVASALFLFTIWQGWNGFQWQPSVQAESAVTAGTATSAQIKTHRDALAYYRKDDAAELTAMQDSWPGLVTHKLRDEWFMPLIAVLFVSGETLTYFLLGMALFKTGFFIGDWPRRRTLGLALGGIGLGGLATGSFALWAYQAHYPETAMRFAISYGLSFAHLAMGLGFAALLAMLTPRLIRTRLGQRITATGRMAFSNYIATSLVMTALFYGWGLGLAGRYGHAELAGFVALGWALMLAWSKPWLDHFRQGPLEWLWRSLTEGKRLPLWR
jgi:uncharacterized protein